MFPACRCASLKCARVLFLLLAVCLLASFGGAQTDNWTGSTGVWSDPAQWDSGVPVAGENINIGTTTANSTDDFSLSIGTLTLGNSGDALTIPDGVTLIVSGPISNAGTITLAGTSTNTWLEIGSNVSLTGNGTLILSSNPNAIWSSNSSNVLTNSSTITGGGSIGNQNMGLVNNGTIISTDSTVGLNINAGASGFSNTGTLETSKGGQLFIIGSANSFLNYNATTNTLTGGTYTANGSSIYFFGSSSGITTLAARVTQEAGGQLMNSTTDTPALANLSSITSTGVLTTTATFNQPGAFSMAGALNILPSTSFSVGSLAQIKNGALTGGQWVLDSNFNITGTPANITTNSATLTLSGGTFFNTSNGTNAFANLSANKKTLRILNFAHFTTVGTLTNSGQMTIAKGCKLTIGGTGTSYSQTTGKTTMDGMLIGTTSIAGGTFLGAGSITGNVALGGTTAATLSLGDAGKAAQVKVTGTYTQNSTGTLTAAIGGTTVATQYSQLKVVGAANVSGTLKATLINAFTPTVGQTFTVLSATSVAGTFSNTTIAINSSEHFAVSYTATSVVLTVASGPSAQ
jgi:hypothetical protein